MLSSDWSVTMCGIFLIVDSFRRAQNILCNVIPLPVGQPYKRKVATCEPTKQSCSIVSAPGFCSQVPSCLGFPYCYLEDETNCFLLKLFLFMLFITTQGKLEQLLCWQSKAFLYSQRRSSRKELLNFPQGQNSSRDKK